jgi:hypothetical protein
MLFPTSTCKFFVSQPFSFEDLIPYINTPSFFITKIELLNLSIFLNDLRNGKIIGKKNNLIRSFFTGSCFNFLHSPNLSLFSNRDLVEVLSIRVFPSCSERSSVRHTKTHSNIRFPIIMTISQNRNSHFTSWTTSNSTFNRILKAS